MKAKLGKWGNSLCIRVPKSVIDVLELKERDECTVSCIQADKKVILDFDKKPDA